ncbi:P-loop containing nucleoside triphosphate hydrolase protein [Collybia nuda]|uniref:P-loop containing nucleoside triphosphate hydrolase protein n=1 Tax=Collybia nuda TaxID=64659 RepID=A0A9P6CAQ2_9AGAR|nr:P-loop containing nucleoside triphosphate hydrolase protein [Collybia nuda]
MGQTDKKPISESTDALITDDAEEKLDDLVACRQFGVWEVITLKDVPFDPKQWWFEFSAGLYHFRRLVGEMYHLSPRMLILFLFSKMWGGVEAAVLMHLSSRLLRIIEIGLVKGEVDAHAIIVAVIARLTCVVIVAVLQWWCGKVLPGFKSRIIHHYEILLMQARLNMDLSASLDPSTTARVSSHDGWQAFESIVLFCAEFLTSASQLSLIIHASRTSGGPFFAVLCVAKPLISVWSGQEIWSQACVMNTNDLRYNRMRALESFSSNHYKEDHISANLGSYILKEYKKVSNELRETCTDDVWEQVDRKNSPYSAAASEILGDLPMVYCAINAIVNPTQYSIASIAVLQQSSLTLRYSINNIVDNTKTVRRQFNKLKSLYALSGNSKQSPDGELPYPKSDSKPQAGMGFEIQNVSFTYPGSKNKDSALKNISLSIKSGDLVVIVGANGSGKSTIIKLLTRLYDATSGKILIDGTPTDDYRALDLRQATAMFTQDHNVFPLSLYENIALGYPEQISNSEMVSKAAESGGATGFINKLADGFNTILDPHNTTYSINVPSDPDNALRKKMEALEKRIDISGGERQRLVASRTFMQLNSGKVKFVAVDEPSSALDPEGEFQLFDHLISGRAGKTMVFVTHRFGHLTKYADTIICMKDGEVAQSGTHEELMKSGGEYAKLYKIQADAFASGGDPYENMDAI